MVLLVKTYLYNIFLSDEWNELQEHNSLQIICTKYRLLITNLSTFILNWFLGIIICVKHFQNSNIIRKANPTFVNCFTFNQNESTLLYATRAGMTSGKPTTTNLFWLCHIIIVVQYMSVQKFVSLFLMVYNEMLSKDLRDIAC